VLEIVDYNGTKLMLLKNPWGHYRWQGRFSHGDSMWTDQMKKDLHYDSFTEDKGVFWMDFEAVCQWFKEIHVNWNPDRYACNKTIYDIWPVAEMEQGKSIVLRNNPQFSINYSPG
jgi:calpain-7